MNNPHYLLKSVAFFFAISLLGFVIASERKDANEPLIYLNEERLLISKQRLSEGQEPYQDAYEKVLSIANEALEKPVDPVTNKTMLPASGDIHDYHTLGSYYWPDETKEDGLPWIYKDGQFNPISNGPETDWLRRKAMFDSLEVLTLAFYFSENAVYLEKAKDIVETWFINNDTKMNPNVDYGKAIPGKTGGTNFSIIDWTDIGKVATVAQLLKRTGLWQEIEASKMRLWFEEYYVWLTTSDFGKLEETRKNNHGTNYDYQAIGLMLYLGKKSDAIEKLNAVKTTRIAAQIEPDGSQPLELARTKSVNYSVNNLWALARITDLGRRHTPVNLLQFESQTGASIKTAISFLVPYILGENKWKWKQISGGGAENQLQNLAAPKINQMALLLGEKPPFDNVSVYEKLSAADVLTYAPY
ncbi:MULTISPECIES: alginate lyase family protein [unclassified Alteromonas]|uniref:alginate lyase family protein n=1 Tax=unclassified Alteromonas TaxID=2614992 RepID=UPI000509CE01|nr:MULTISPECIES: alginate lyase family protein [unclassified Alteromonas]